MQAYRFALDLTPAQERSVLAHAGAARVAHNYLIPDERWSDRLAAISFWSLNLGLAWMSFATLLPAGALQLYKVVDAGYADGRSLGYLQGGTNMFLEWLRLPGDVVFMVGGVVPLLWMTYLGIRYRSRRTRSSEAPAETLLFTEVVPTGAEDPDLAVAAATGTVADGAEAASPEAAP
ncbi:helix-turn-helix domain-containing protein [Micromonospora solifontis]|uniref:helix-turn-helix domain-containing protein n=1 Tax=Micromonospora solifontis TaxID=2487138 RepID=UPI001319C9A8|nr:helix-turn-helix domain-containing protein [Micromonospora solifontis]